MRIRDSAMGSIYDEKAIDERKIDRTASLCYVISLNFKEMDFSGNE
jgi:hypothetical protein